VASLRKAKKREFSQFALKTGRAGNFLRFFLLTLLVVPFFTNCGENQFKIRVIDKQDPSRETNCVHESQVTEGTKYKCADGTERIGRLVFENSALCKEDGELGCYTNPNFKAVDMSKLQPEQLAAGTTLAGISGQLVPAVGVVPCTSPEQRACYLP
jgi:hypothetical protein